MLQLKNQSPFCASFFVFPNVQGVDTLFVVVKATFDLAPKVQVAEKQTPVVLADEYFGDPGQSSLSCATEAHLEKPGMDVVVVAQACAPHERPVPELDAGLSVAGRTLGARVFGDRQWKVSVLSTKLSKPEPFTRMPLVYERAYGGMHVVDESEGKILLEPKNPVGKGFKGKRGLAELPLVGVPNIEDPKNLISTPQDSPKPIGFSFVSPAWEPRYRYGGTYDEAWQKTRAPYLPPDFDPRYFHVAPPELIFERPFVGGEEVVTINLSPTSRQKFRIPRLEWDIRVRRSGQVEKLNPKLETILLEPTEARMSLTSRAAMVCDKGVLRIEEISVSLGQLELL